MTLFYKIKNYLSACSESTQQSTLQTDEPSHEAIQHLNSAECIEVAGGPQVRNEPDIV